MQITNEAKVERLSVALPERLKSDVLRIAVASERSLAAQVRLALREHVDRHPGHTIEEER